MNLVGSSPILWQKQDEHVVDTLALGERESGFGLNQELSLRRSGDTCWGSHFRTILNVLSLYPTILDVLDTIRDFSTDKGDKNKAESLSLAFMSLDFAFITQLMVAIFGITKELNMALQKRDQDIVNAMTLVHVTMRHLQKIRDDGWDSHMNKVTSFCVKHDIEILTWREDTFF